VRVAALGGFSLLLATGAHLMGGGDLPTPTVLALAALLLGLAAAVVTARRCRFGALMAVLSVQQVLLHTLFELAAQPQSCVQPAAGLGHAGVTDHMVAVCTTVAHAPAMSAQAGWLMWTAHLVATACTAWLLKRGEAWLWGLVDRVAAAAGLGRTRKRQRPAGRGLLASVVAQSAARTWRPARPRGPPGAVAG